MEVRYLTSNPLVPDSDADGCGDAREVATVNGDRTVNAIDLSQVAQKFGAVPVGLGSFDQNGDGTINAIDLSRIAQRFGPCS